MDWFTTNDVLVDTFEVQEVRWRAKDEPVELGLVKDENVAHVYAIYVYVVWLDLS